MRQILHRHVLCLGEELARGYAWVALLPRWTAGIPLLLITLVEPHSGLVGLIAAVFSGWLTGVFGRLAWSLIQLPILSLPFALVAMFTAAAGRSISTLGFSAYVAPPSLFGLQIDQFLSAFGNLYFLSDPLAGLLVLLVLAAFSRYYLVIASLGYLAALLWLKLMGVAPEHLVGTAWGSNAILAALLVGGLFARPSVLTALLALLAAVMASWLALALGNILAVAHLLPFSIPFVLAAWLVLYAALRNVKLISRFNIATPDLPECSHERAQISRGRVGDPASVALALPFDGEWTVSQGVSGRHTHRGLWRYALDFIVIKDGTSFSGHGNRLEDFHCYGQPVLSPAYGQVWRIANDIPDNTPGTVNVAAHWGNCVVIRIADGKFVVVAHLKPGSVRAFPGSWVKPGDLLGHCGNSGRSPQPHIHLHLQAGDEPGAPTLPFHLASVLISEHGEAPRYELAVVPKESSSLTRVIAGDVRPFPLLAGRGLRYRVQCEGNAASDWTLRCEVDEQGRLVLVSSNGGRCVAESTWAVFSCYERSGAADPYLDLWLLACGYTPASFHVDRWSDRFTPARLLTQATAQWVAAFAWPWASFAESHYRRQWDEMAQGWRQIAIHRQKKTGIEITTEALIAPQLGCTSLSGDIDGSRYTLQATKTFQRADIGVPGWESPLALSSSIASFT